MAKQGKERIIAAAFQLFLENGYKGVGLKDIIEKTGLSKGAIYHHFESKYAIFVAAVEEYFFKVINNTFPNDESLDLRQRLRLRYEYFADVISYIESLGTNGIAYPIRSYFIFILESEKDKAISLRMQESVEVYRQEITQLIEVAIQKKEIDSPLSASIIAQHIIVMTEGVAIHNSYLEKNSKEFLMERYEEVIVKYLDLILAKESIILN